MGYRIDVEMALVPGATHRLFALLAQRHIDVEAAAFHSDRQAGRIRATLDVEVSEAVVGRLARQLARHQDIYQITVHQDGRPLTARVKPTLKAWHVRRMNIDIKKGACL